MAYSLKFPENKPCWIDFSWGCQRLVKFFSYNKSQKKDRRPKKIHPLPNGLIPFHFRTYSRISPFYPFLSRLHLQMALKALHLFDVPNIDHVPDNASLSPYSSSFSKGILYWIFYAFFFLKKKNKNCCLRVVSLNGWVFVWFFRCIVAKICGDGAQREWYEYVAVVGFEDESC